MRKTKKILCLFSKSSQGGQEFYVNLCCDTLSSPSPFISKECAQFHVPRAISFKKEERGRMPQRQRAKGDGGGAELLWFIDIKDIEGRGKEMHLACLPACLSTSQRAPIHLMKSNSHALFYTVTSHTNNRNRIEPANATDYGLKKVQCK